MRKPALMLGLLVVVAVVVVVVVAGAAVGVLILRPEAIRSTQAPEEIENMARLLELRIEISTETETDSATIAGDGSVRIRATLRNTSDRTVSIGCRLGQLPVQELFRWRVRPPSGNTATRGVNLTAMGDRTLFFRGLQISMVDDSTPDVRPEQLEPGESIKIEFRYPGSTQLPKELGENHVALHYHFRCRECDLRGKRTADGLDLEKFKVTAATPEFAQGTITSNEITITRLAK